MNADNVWADDIAWAIYEGLVRSGFASDANNVLILTTEAGDFDATMSVNFLDPDTAEILRTFRIRID
jgi:hypothetical protein